MPATNRDKFINVTFNQSVQEPITVQPTAREKSMQAAKPDVQAISDYIPGKSLSPEPGFTIRTNSKSVKYNVSARIKELGLPKQPLKANIFLHKDFRGLLHADYQGAVAKVYTTNLR